MELNTDYRAANKNPYFEYVLLFATGFFGLSTFANVIVNRLGVYLIEILLVPAVVYYIRTIGFTYNNRIKLSYFDMFQILFLLFSTMIGIINTGAIFDVVTCIRPYVYLLLILKIIRDKDLEIDCNKLYLVALGCVIGDFVYTRRYSVFAVLQGYQHINIIAVALIVVIPMITGKRILAIVSIGIASTISIISGYRINILVFFVSVISCLIINMMSSKRIRSHLFYIILMIGLYYGIMWVVNNFDIVASFLSTTLKMDSLNSSRTFGRIQLLLNRNLTLGDQNRLRGFQQPFLRFLSNLFPVGPIGKTNLSHFGEYTDKPILFLYDIYGSIISWFFVVSVLFYFIKQTIRILKLARNGLASEYNMVFVALFPVIIVLFLLNGTFFTFVNISILFGFAIGGFNINRKQVNKCLLI